MSQAKLLAEKAKADIFFSEDRRRFQKQGTGA